MLIFAVALAVFCFDIAPLRFGAAEIDTLCAGLAALQKAISNVRYRLRNGNGVHGTTVFKGILADIRKAVRQNDLSQIFTPKEGHFAYGEHASPKLQAS